ncbi:methyltransferase [Actinocrispum sp. NPDC049592]|uniref:methyltransferase n=1 Tax=Actinocrispum sp. NPDC049592 TaxID=3154835 RepID=UPI0034309BDE
MDLPKTTRPMIMAMADLGTPMSIRVAATLRLVDRAGSAGATAEELAAETGTVALALRRVLDHLVTVGVFEVLESGRYRGTELGAQIGEFRHLLDMNCAGGRAELGFVELLGTVTSGVPGYVQRYGQEFWADIDAQPELRRSFDAQMNWRFRGQQAQIAERFDWGRFAEIVDVGGGDGMLLEAILTAHPEVRGKVVELAPSAAAAAERFEKAGLADRAEGVPGSFLDPLPTTGADAYVLSDILHDWDDEHANTILARCVEAARPDSAVVLIEAMHGRAGTGMDLFMLMCFGGHERTVEELTELAAGHGLVLNNETDVSDERVALEFQLGQRK